MIALLRRTRDMRNKHNIIFGSFLLITLALSAVFFAYAKSIYIIFNQPIFLKIFFSYYNFFILVLISIYFSRRVYYWHYQKEKFILKDNVNNAFSDVSIKLKVEIFSYVIASIFPFILITSILLAGLAKKGYFEIEEFIAFFSVKAFFLYYVIKNKLKKMDVEKFNQIELNGVCTNYSIESKEIK